MGWEESRRLGVGAGRAGVEEEEAGEEDRRVGGGSQPSHPGGDDPRLLCHSRRRDRHQVSDLRAVTAQTPSSLSPSAIALLLLRDSFNSLKIVTVRMYKRDPLYVYAPRGETVETDIPRSRLSELQKARVQAPLVRHSRVEDVL